MPPADGIKLMTLAASPSYQGRSADGSTIFFDSAQELTGQPTEGAALFESVDGAIHMIHAALPGDGPVPAYIGSSSDGSHVFFHLDEPDGFDRYSIGLYEWSAGIVTQIASGEASPGFVCASPDGSRVVFNAYRPLTSSEPSDEEDAIGNLYEWDEGTLRLLTVDPKGEAPLEKFVVGSANECKDFFFWSGEDMLPGGEGGAKHGNTNLYELEPDGIHLVDSMPPSHELSAGATFVGFSADGSHSFFTTHAASLYSAQTDLFEHFDDTTRYLVEPPLGGEPPHDVVYDGSSADGSDVFFETAQPLVPEDTNNVDDVYERTSSGVVLISTGTALPAARKGAHFIGASSDGSTVVFGVEAPGGPFGMTTYDLFVRSPSRVEEIPTLPAAPTVYDVDELRVVRVASDGSRVIFESPAQLLPEDTSTQPVAYVFEGGSLTLAAPGQISPPAGELPESKAGPGWILGTTEDGRTIFLGTYQRLNAEDTSDAWHIWRITRDHAAPPPTITIERPTDGSHYAYGESVAAGYSCTDLSGWGIASCQGNVADGGKLETFVPGVHTFTITAADRTGVQSSRTVEYVVDPSTPQPLLARTQFGGTAASTGARISGHSTSALEPDTEFQRLLGSLRHEDLRAALRTGHLYLSVSLPAASRVSVRLSSGRSLLAYGSAAGATSHRLLLRLTAAGIRQLQHGGASVKVTATYVVAAKTHVTLSRTLTLPAG